MKLRDIFEAEIASKNVGLALPKIISYLGRKMGAELIRIPGVEHFHNSTGNGYGARYVESGTTRCIRINWNTAGHAGKSSDITSIDIFNGQRDPSFTIHTKGLSFVQALPMVAAIARSPSLGRHFMFPINPKELEASMNEAVLTEVARDAFTAEEALTDFLNQLAQGKTYTRSDFIQHYHIVHAGIFDTVMKDFADKFSISNKRIALTSNANLGALKDSILSRAGVVEVVKGGSKEQYFKSKQEEQIEAGEERVPYADTLEHLEGLVQALIKGSYNALFVTGKGGSGKTQTVERVLHANGLSDGDGYFKNTGSASAAGVYTLLYHHRNDIILFDDSDGALADVDSRNLIKAATDTKKSRKMVWNKKSSFIFNPEEEDPEAYEDDLGMAPKYFDFKGRIIFISNLPLAKLDPDGALRTRAFVINVDPTNDELYGHMGKILMDIQLEDGLKLSKTEREHVLDVVKSSKRKGDVSLRKLVRGLNLAASGAPNWARLVELYA